MAARGRPVPAPRRPPRRNVFQDAPELQRFVLPNVQSTGRQLGHGSYGVVEELKINGLVCAGKKIYEVLVNQANEGFDNVVRRYVEECQLLSDMRHPHVVQFMGLCFMQDSSLPVIVMEMLKTSLDELLEGTTNIPLALRLSMLTDVAKGLVYLHNHIPRAVIHRDLSAKNVLLNSSMVAKISDLGNSRIVFLQPGQLAKTLSKGPGTLVYMPPEALYSPPGTDPSKSRYGVKMDIFSFGHLALFTITQVFPRDLLPPNYPDPQDASRLLGRSEVERRRDYIARLHQQLGQDNPLVQLIKRCLGNDPAHRPSAEEVLQRLEEVEIEDPYQHLTKLEMVRLIEGKEAEVARKVEEIRERETELGQNREEIRHKDVEIRRKDEQIRNLQTGVPEVQPHLLHPRARLQWRKCADFPVGMGRPQCVLVGGGVYVGGGVGEDDDDNYRVLEYHSGGDEWSTLPDCPVTYFAMGQFQGHLITVGGATSAALEEDTITEKVYHYKKESRQWKEFLKPLRTARCFLSIITTQSAIIACGGGTEGEDGESGTCATVEVYTTETNQWHTTDPLPISCWCMSSVTIADTCYLLGGVDPATDAITTVLCASISSLIRKAVSHPQQSTASPQPSGSSSSVWKTLPDTPLATSAAASLGGCLLAVGGGTEEDKASSAIHVYFPPTSAWVKLTSGELPNPTRGHTAIQLSDNEVFICSGFGSSREYTKDVYIGSTTLADN